MHRSPSTWRLRQTAWALIALLASPLLAVLVADRLWRRRKPVIGWAEKWSGRVAAVAPGQVIVHGVSLGEVNVMSPLVPLIETHFRTRCLLTTTTSTGREALDLRFADRDRAFLPLDRPAAVRCFLGRTRPRALILLELEVWPVLISECHIRGIPVLLLNARVGDDSFRGYRRAGPWLRPLFAGIALAAAQNPLWGARLRALGVPRKHVRSVGSLKADLVQPQRSGEAWITDHGLDPARPVLLLASTSAGANGSEAEEAIALGTTLPRWRERGWQVVIAPRHPERGDAVAALVQRLGGAARRSSRKERIDRDDAVLIVDEIGRLNSLYAHCAASNGIAIVGGSLGSGRHGQNMLEAAAAGCCTVVGPDTRNFPDAMGLLRSAQAVVVVDLPLPAEVLAGLAEDDSRRRDLGHRAQGVWAASRGTLARVDALLQHWCRTARRSNADS